MIKSLPILCVMAPTAMGKSDLALKLASKFSVEIVSVDASQVYLGMNIGTAKPSLADLERHKHWLVDVCDPGCPYSLGRFYQDVQKVIACIHQRGKIPLLIGGTMMYFRALRDGLASLPQSDGDLRAVLLEKLASHGCPHLHQELANIDPQAASRIAPTDPQRILRALEVYHLTGNTISALQQEKKPLYDNIRFYRWQCQSRAHLRARITQRFLKMLADGLIDEVQRLFDRGDLSLELPSIRSIGYRQVWQHLQGDFDRDVMEQTAITATCQLAKRQNTWLNAWQDAQVLPESAADAYQLLSQDYQKLSMAC